MAQAPVHLPGQGSGAQKVVPATASKVAVCIVRFPQVAAHSRPGASHCGSQPSSVLLLAGARAPKRRPVRPRDGSGTSTGRRYLEGRPKRLEKPLPGRGRLDYDGTQATTSILGGRAMMDEFIVDDSWTNARG